MTEQKFIKDVISKCRKEKQLTQEQLADLLNVSNKTVSKWERGISYPDITLIPTLAKVLDISVSDLFNVQETTPKKRTFQDELYNMERINSYNLQMFISFCMLLGSILFGVLCVMFVPKRLVINLCLILSIIIIFSSISLAIFSSYSFYSFFNNKLHKQKYVSAFVKSSFSYILIIYMMIMVYNAFSFKGNLLSLLLVILEHIIFALIPFLFLNKNKNNEPSKIISILRIFSILLFLVNSVLYLFLNIILNIILFAISQMINYIIIFIENRNTILREI